jgi:ribosomal protein S12 methylthiotransferase
MPAQVDPSVGRDRAARVAAIADATMERRARSLIGHDLEVLVERLDLDEDMWTGRSHREAPEVDGEIRFKSTDHLHVGDYVTVRIDDVDGVDLIASHS